MVTENFTKYAFATIEVENMLLAEEASITVDRMTNSQPVFTTIHGYNGESPGSLVVELTVEAAVPSAGFEMDPGPYMAALGVGVDGEKPEGVDFKIHLANSKTLNFKGYVISDSFNHSVNAASKLSFKARGKFASQWS